MEKNELKKRIIMGILVVIIGRFLFFVTKYVRFKTANKKTDIVAELFGSLGYISKDKKTSRGYEEYVYDDDDESDNSFNRGYFEFGRWESDSVVDAGYTGDQLLLLIYDNRDYYIVNTSTGETFKNVEDFHNSPDLKHVAFICSEEDSSENQSDDYGWDIEDRTNKTLYIDGKKIYTAKYIGYLKYLTGSGKWFTCAEMTDSSDGIHNLFINGRNITETKDAIRQFEVHPNGTRFCYYTQDGNLYGIYFENKKILNNCSLENVDFSLDGNETIISYMDNHSGDGYVYSRSTGKKYGPFYKSRDLNVASGKTAGDWAFTFGKDHNLHVNFKGKEYGNYEFIDGFTMDKETNHLYYYGLWNQTIYFYEDCNKIFEIPRGRFVENGEIYNKKRFLYSKGYKLFVAMTKDENNSLVCDVFKNGSNTSVDLGKAKMRSVCFSPDSKYIYYYDGKSSIGRIDTDSFENTVFCKLSKSAVETKVRCLQADDDLVYFNGYVCFDGKEYQGKKVAEKMYFCNNGDDTYTLIRR